MSTVLSNKTITLEESSSLQLAPKKVLKNTYASVLNALNADKKIVLVTADAQKGKTALLHTISRDVASSNRIISISGKDLPALDPSKTDVSHAELNSMKSFIIESTDLNDKLIVTLDDANYLPINFLSALISHANSTATSNHNFQLLLTGPANFKDQLLSINELDNDDLTHCPMHGMNNKEILEYIKTKTYKISSNIKNIKFEAEALQALCEFAQTDKKLLSVVLEWCAALTKKDQLDHVAVDDVHRAANFAQQFSKDKNLRLTNSYPPSHEVYKYINDLQSNHKTVKNSESSKSNKKKQTHKVKNPITTSKIETVLNKNKPPSTTNKNHTVEQEFKKDLKAEKIPVIEDEVMPPQWIPIAKKRASDKKPLTALAGLLATLVIAFVFFIATRIGTDPVVDDSISPQIADNEKHLSPTMEQPKTIIENTQITPPKETVIQKPKVAPLVIGSLDQSLLSEKPNSTEPQKQGIETDKTDSEINKLLNLAEQQFINKKLSTPAGDNALETYKKVLSSQPNNTAALYGITKVHDKYFSWANYYTKRNDFDRAKRFYQKALEINPSNSAALEGLQNIEGQQISPAQLDATLSNTIEPDKNNVSSEEIQALLQAADTKMLQIIEGINNNKRNYKAYQEAHAAYQNILRQQPQNQQAKQGLSSLLNYYVDWAELQIQSRNYNIALFLYGQALSIDPNNEQLSQRIEQVREIKSSL